MEPESTVSIPIARLHEALPTHKRGAHASSAGTRISGLAENHSSGTACRHEALGKRTPALGALADAMAGRPIFTAASMAAADPTDFTALGDFQAQISDLQQQIDALEEEWMEAAEKLGE